MFSLFNVSSFFQGGSADPICPYVRTPMHPVQSSSRMQHYECVLFCSLAVLDPRVGHTIDILSPFISVLCQRWLGSRVVSVLDSGAEGPGFISQNRSRDAVG